LVLEVEYGVDNASAEYAMRLIVDVGSIALRVVFKKSLCVGLSILLQAETGEIKKDLV
jgi:hypothetical protein